MSLLTAQGISEAVSKYVDKQEKNAISDECEIQMDQTTEHVLQRMVRLKLQRCEKFKKRRGVKKHENSVAYFGHSVTFVLFFTKRQRQKRKTMAQYPPHLIALKVSSVVMMLENGAVSPSVANFENSGRLEPLYRFLDLGSIPGRVDSGTMSNRHRCDIFSELCYPGESCGDRLATLLAHYCEYDEDLICFLIKINPSECAEQLKIFPKRKTLCYFW